jgi:hypothetical protein
MANRGPKAHADVVDADGGRIENNRADRDVLYARGRHTIVW